MTARISRLSARSRTRKFAIMPEYSHERFCARHMCHDASRKCDSGAGEVSRETRSRSREMAAQYPEVASNLL